MENKTVPLPTTALSAQNLRVFFISHLNRIYCAKSHLQKQLPQIREHAHFTDLSHAITETLIDVEKQLARMDTIYHLIGVSPDGENCHGMIGLIEDTFSAIYNEKQDPEMRDLSILFYLQNIESIEKASFKMLNLAAPLIDKKEIRQLLKESFDEATEDLTLFQLIASNYFKKK
jgi:ferritin-like metal-binding protein YciE